MKICSELDATTPVAHPPGSMEQIDQESLLRELVNETPEILYAKDMNSRFTFANQALAERMGFVSPSEMIGKTDLDFFPAHLAERFRTDELRILEHGESLIDQMEIQTLPGHPEAWTLTTKRPLRNAQGVIVGLIGSSRDITSRRYAERQLIESETRTRALARNASEIVAILDPSGAVRYVSPSLAGVMGYQPDDLIGTDAFAFDHPDDLPHIQTWFASLLGSSGVEVTADLRVRHADGEWRWFEVIGTNLLDDPAINGLVVNARDITERKYAEVALRLRDRAISAVTNGIIIADATQPDVPIIDVNAAFERITGYTAAEVIGRNCRFLQGEETDPGDVAIMRRAIEQGIECEVSLRNFRKDGTLFWNDVRLSPVRGADGGVTHIVGILTDITERMWIDDELHFQGELLNQATAAVVATDPTGVITHWNRHANRLFGWTASEAIGQAVPSATFGPTSQQVIDQIAAQLLTGASWEGEFETRCKDGHTIYVQGSVAPVNDSRGNLVGIVNVSIDVQERRNLQERLERLAYFDTLTGLPNRTSFLDSLQRSMESGHTPNVLFIDLDRFKIVNDSLGHVIGDELLIQVAERFQRTIRPGDTLARFGGDEFALLLNSLGPQSNADMIARRLIDALHVPFDLEGREAFIGASIGIAVGSLDKRRAEGVLRDAEIALYEAKRAGRGRWAHFAGEIGERAARRMQLETELRHALNREEFEVYYQPVVELQSGRINGFEALVRWRHPVRGLISPGEFLPVAEETGLIVPLGEWVLGQACRQAASWHDRFPGDPLVMAVNISPRQFQGPAFGHALWRVLGETGLPPHRLKLEVTEEALAQDADAAEMFLSSLKAMGIRLALDDFGTGYSSLGRLHTFPLDVIKIDRSFTATLGKDFDASSIIRAVVTLGHELGLTVTAEGIESEEQHRRARELGCNAGQGYLFSPPVPAEAATQLLLAINHPPLTETVHA